MSQRQTSRSAATLEEITFRAIHLGLHVEHSQHGVKEIVVLEGFGGFALKTCAVNRVGGSELR